MNIRVAVNISRAELLRAICQAVCDSLDFRADEWCEDDAATLESAARLIREQIKEGHQ